MTVEVGIILREDDLASYPGGVYELGRQVAAAGIDYAGVGDHVTFNGGQGCDGLLQAMALLSVAPTLRVETSIYLLALRNPVVVSRQLATIAALAPGRFTLGVGVGGEDATEFEACAVDVTSRGARTNESLSIIAALRTGEPVTFDGDFFHLDDVRMIPAQSEPIPILVGGRADAALVRAGKFGEGWLALWASPERFEAGTARVEQVAAEEGRAVANWRHTLNLWCGFGNDAPEAKARLGPKIEELYGIPYQKFERYTPCGTPADVAAELKTYRDAGCERFSIVPVSAGLEESIQFVAEVAGLLRSSTQ